MVRLLMQLTSTGPTGRLRQRDADGARGRLVEACSQPSARTVPEHGRQGFCCRGAREQGGGPSARPSALSPPNPGWPDIFKEE